MKKKKKKILEGARGSPLFTPSSLLDDGFNPFVTDSVLGEDFIPLVRDSALPDALLNLTIPTFVFSPSIGTMTLKT